MLGNPLSASAIRLRKQRYGGQDVAKLVELRKDTPELEVHVRKMK